MSKTLDLAHIRATLVDRIAQHTLRHNRQTEQPPSAVPKHTKDIEGITYWQSQVDLSARMERDYALESSRRSAQFEDDRLAYHRW